MTHYRATTFAILTLCACQFVSEGVPAQDSSSGFTDDASDSSVSSTSVSTTATTTVTAGGSSGSGSGASESDTSDGTDPTFGDDATTTHGESSTGEAGTDYALAFDGGLALSEATSVVDFDGSPYTIEAWLEVSASTEGVLFDTTVVVPTDGNGVTLVYDPAYTMSENMVFYDWGATPPLWVAGPDPSALAPTWHHVAITHDGDVLKMWIDGELVASKPADSTASNAEASIAIGTQPTTPFVPLRGVAIDELKISPSVLYVDPFVPDRSLGEQDAALYWTFSEGSGSVATDLITGLDLMIDEDVTWQAIE